MSDFHRVITRIRIFCST